LYVHPNLKGRSVESQISPTSKREKEGLDPSSQRPAT
jgi:hypothetical protein